jgi:hypothetical protein
MLAQFFADTPQWVVDGKNYLGFFVAFLAAVASVWKYGIKPYLEHREAERQRALMDAALLRKGEITAALIPLQEQLRLEQAEVKKYTDKLLLQGDAIHGINNRLDDLTREQQELHADVRAHMQAEDAKKDGR